MTELNPPGFLQNAGATHTAEQTRDWLSILVQGRNAASPSMIARGGVNPYLGNQLSVTQAGSPNMTVLAKSGFAVVPGSEGSKQGCYFVGNDADVTLAIAASHATLNRIDIVCFKVEDQAYSGSNNTSSLVVVTGTPAASPSPPAAPNNSITIAQVAVNAAVTTITNSNITDVRPWLVAVGGVQRATSTAQPSNPIETQMIYETDFDRISAHDGTSFKPLAWTTNPFVYVRRTATQAVANGVSTYITWTSEVSDRSGLFTTSSDTFTVPTGYDGLWSIKSYCRFATNTTGVRLMTMEVTGAVVVENRRDALTSGGSQPTQLHVCADVLLVAGDTVKISVFQASGVSLNIEGGTDTSNPKLMLSWLGR